MARIATKRRLRPLLVLVFFSVAGCASQTTISKPKPRPGGIYHVVTPGETLFRIGKAYGVTYQ